MKNRVEKKINYAEDKILDQKFELSSIKRTDINVLLNRVRTDKKRIFKKKLFTFLFLTSLMLAAGLFHTFN